jgi:hypothetical protein
MPAYFTRINATFQGAQTTGYIQFLADDAHLLCPARDFHARVPRDARVDILRSCKWLSICRKEPGRLCNTLNGDVDGAKPPLQPSDLIKMCICVMPRGAEYVASSYC